VICRFSSFCASPEGVIVHGVLMAAWRRRSIVLVDVDEELHTVAALNIEPKCNIYCLFSLS
jgi:hypothetical protein